MSLSQKLSSFFCVPLFYQCLNYRFLCHEQLVLTMPDPRLVVGAAVEAKAIHVTNLSECSRRYGNNAKKVVPGFVVSFHQASSPGQPRASTVVVADYYFGGNIVKRVQLNIRSVKAVESSELHDRLREILQQREAEILRLNVVGGSMSPAPAPPNPSPGTLAAGMPTPMQAMAPGQMTPQQAATTRTPPTTAAAPQLNDEAEISPTSLTFHNTEWFEAEQSILEQEMNGPVAQRFWSITDSRSGTVLERDCDQGDLMSRLDYFLLMFPPQSLLSIVRLTSQKLLLLSKPATTKGEIVKFFGIIILSTKFEFDDRRSLWATEAPSKYIPTPLFGKLMPRNRFDDLWRCIRFSEQPSVRPAEMTAEQYRWKLVDDFVTQFNEHRASTFSPSERICVDESISRWYGKGGHWINHGLPMYVAIDRKPENGCEIQCASCGQSGIMLRLKLVKTAEEETWHIALMDEVATGEVVSDQGLLHGAKVMRELVSP
jgi:hypothetical protein